MFFLYFLPIAALTMVLGTIMVRRTAQDAKQQAAASDAAGDVITHESVEWRPWRLFNKIDTASSSPVLTEDDPAFMTAVSAVAARLLQERAQA